MFKVMRIVEHGTNDIYWCDGHNEDEAYAGFGHNIEITKLIAVPEDQVVKKEE